MYLYHGSLNKRQDIDTEIANNDLAQVILFYIPDYLRADDHPCSHFRPRPFFRN